MENPQVLGYTLWFSLFSLKLNIFPFSASILTFSTQNHVKIRWFCVEKVRIEALNGKIFNFNENNENHKVYPSACGKIHGVPSVKESDTKRRRQKPGSKVFCKFDFTWVVTRPCGSIFLFLYFMHLIHVMMRSL